MKKISAQIVRHFTLIELMIAMTVLVIMMGFLFQFTISAQRLWSASNNNDVLFEQAQLCFDLIEKDLKAAIVQDATRNPGRGVPYYINPSVLNGSAAQQLLFVITQTDSSAVEPDTGSQTYPVVYYTDAANNLYRRVLDSVITPPDTNPLHCYGMSEADFSSWRAGLNTVFLPQDTQYRICENISSVGLDQHSSATIDDFHMPEVVKITLVLTDPAVKDPNATNTRIFSKTIFLQ